ncbi:MAG: dephospho-CoA kinase [Pseudomonadota bacterium]
MHVLGLTGSIGMGKSTTAGFFREAGIPVHDADAVVHEAYAGHLAPVIENAFPGTTMNGVVNRAKLAEFLKGAHGPANLKKLEAIVHPIVRSAEEEFRKQHKASGSPLVVLDIPLLFETGRQDAIDSVLVVTAPADVQRQRVMARSGMTAEKFDAIVKRQMPDAEKRALADHLIDTSLGLERARAQVERIVQQLTHAA